MAFGLHCSAQSGALAAQEDDIYQEYTGMYSTYITSMRSRSGIRAPLFGLKMGLLLHRRTTFIKSIKECTVYNENEAQAWHSGSIVQLKVGLLMNKRTTFIKS